MKKVSSGKQVIVPGVANIEEFSQEIDQEELRKLVEQKHFEMKQK